MRFADVAPEHFPLRFDFHSVLDDRLMHTIECPSPGVMHVPGRDFFKEPVYVITTAGDGSTHDSRED